MLSQDLISVIDNICEKIETNQLDSSTSNEIKNACFIVMGQIERLKSIDLPSDNSKEKELISYKRNVIHLIEWQAKFIELKKNIILGNYIDDLNFIMDIIYSIPKILCLDMKDKIEKITYFISCMIANINKLKYKLHGADCFDLAFTAHNECTRDIIYLYSKLLEMHHTEKMRYSVMIKGYFEAIQELFDFYLNEIVYFRELEITNAKCLSYCVMNYIPKNV